MRFSTKSVVSFLKPNKGLFTDDGGSERSYDSTKVHAQTEVSDDLECIGMPFVEYNWGTSDNFYEFKKKYQVQPPFQAELVFENQSTGKTSKLVLVDVKPLAQPK